MKLINRISKIFALFVVYIFCAYGYLTAKGFVFDKGIPVLSNHAEAKEEFARKITADFILGDSLNREEGDINAPLTMYAFSSMMCSHCEDFHRYIYPKIKKEFIDTGKLRFVFVHLPLDVLSMQAAKLSYCLPKDKYYSFIERLYSKKDWRFAKNDKKLNEYTKEFGFTEDDIKYCKDNKKITSDILLVRDNAITKLGIMGTPSFVVVGKDGKEIINGAKKYSHLKDYIEKRLDENK
ncbi:MAG: thioredoxin domain-containing protein [Alphaproteobacteria bacterium]|nr:thioredoxin domain-containing protein [Alphaproteobacteria bacterium]